MRTQDVLGQLLVAVLRDNAIDLFDGLAADHWKSERLKALQQRVRGCDDDVQSLMREVVVTAVDYGIHEFLSYLEGALIDGDISISAGGEQIDLSESLTLELGSEEMGDGWIGEFSKHATMGPDPD